MKPNGEHAKQFVKWGKVFVGGYLPAEIHNAVLSASAKRGLSKTIIIEKALRQYLRIKK